MKKQFYASGGASAKLDDPIGNGKKKNKIFSSKKWVLSHKIACKMVIHTYKIAQTHRWLNDQKHIRTDIYFNSCKVSNISQKGPRKRFTARMMLLPVVMMMVMVMVVTLLTWFFIFKLRQSEVNTFKTPRRH